MPEINAGDDLASILEGPLRALGLRDGDIVVVTSKAVSKAEGRVVPQGGGKASWVARETARVVARRGDLVISETRHGFVCANAGVDESNVDPGSIALLPEDPDATAESLRGAIGKGCRVDIGVVITDTFGRPWRTGLVDVAIGCAGIPALMDLRGSRDSRGRVLESTVIAVADQIAAASGLVMPKAEGVPAAIVRGYRARGEPRPARDLVRAAEEDMFRESPLQSLHGRRTIRTFGDGAVDPAAVEEAVVAACTAPAPHHTRPWGFATVRSPSARRHLLDAMEETWRRDLRGDGLAEVDIERRIRRSDDLLASAPLLVIPMIRLSGAHDYPDRRRRAAEREMFLLSGGAAIQNLLLALHDQGLASCWISSTLFCKPDAVGALGLAAGWEPLGAVAIGHPPADVGPPRLALEVEEHLLWL